MELSDPVRPRRLCLPALLVRPPLPPASATAAPFSVEAVRLRTIAASSTAVLAELLSLRGCVVATLLVPPPPPPPPPPFLGGTPEPRLISGCKNLHSFSILHQPFDFQWRQTITLFSGLCSGVAEGMLRTASKAPFAPLPPDAVAPLRAGPMDSPEWCSIIICASGSVVGMRGDRRRGSVVGTSGDAVGVRLELPGCCSDHARYIGFVLAAAAAAACADSALNNAAHEPSGAVMLRAGEFLEDSTKGTPPPGRVPDAVTAGSGPCIFGEDPLDELLP
mmetsp:Transcript_81344/g.204664  ORF Transcript_81344/g.204664 Transcript_81344/m.204664 type:complete len:277 (-) Transcript_81344:711-1541(-)